MSTLSLAKKVEDLVTDKIKKLGPFNTFLTLFKGFVNIGILFLPHTFSTGGFLF